MKDIIKENILDLIEKVTAALKDKDILALRKYSNYTIHNASVFQSQSSTAFAVIVYSLTKVMEMSGKQEEKKVQKFIDSVLEEFSYCRKQLLSGNISKYKAGRNRILEKIAEMDDRLDLYMQEVIEKSKVKKGSEMYGHGISMGKVAELLGLSRWDLMAYIGKTTIIDTEEKATDARSRLLLARKIFGLGRKV